MPSIQPAMNQSSSSNASANPTMNTLDSGVRVVNAGTTTIYKYKGKTYQKS